MFIYIFDLNGHGFYIATTIFVLIFVFSAYSNILIIKSSIKKGVNWLSKLDMWKLKIKIK